MIKILRITFVRKIYGWVQKELFKGLSCSFFVKFLTNYRNIQLTNCMSLPMVDPQLVRSALNRELKWAIAEMPRARVVHISPLPPSHAERRRRRESESLRWTRTRESQKTRIFLTIPTASFQNEQIKQGRKKIERNYIVPWNEKKYMGEESKGERKKQNESAYYPEKKGKYMGKKRVTKRYMGKVGLDHLKGIWNRKPNYLRCT